MPRPAQGIDRRDFVRRTTGALAALPFARLGEELDRLLAPTPSRVALVRTADRRRGVSQVLALFAPKGIAGKRVLIKPNFNSADEAPASTHADTLSQLVTELQERDARSVTVGESSGPPRTRGVMQAKGIFDLARDLRFDVVDYEQLADGEWMHFEREGTHWPGGFWLPRMVVASEYNVSTCCLKTHGAGGVFSMSLKLSVGLTPKPRRLRMHLSRNMRRMIAELNTGYAPKLIVLDGVSAFTDGGPSHGVLAPANVMLAGSDRVAIDAVGLAVLRELGANRAIMDRRIYDQEQIARAVELGLGAPSPASIQIMTADEESERYARKLRAILALG